MKLIELNQILFSVAFASMMFCTLYICGKLQVFNQRGRGKSWRLLLGLLPLFGALVVSLSRTCDYHHHWQGKNNLKFDLS